MDHRVFYRFVRWVIAAPLEIFYSLDTKGQENIPEGGAIICPSHHSMLDAFLLVGPLYPRKIRFLATAGLFWQPLGFFLKRAGVVPVDRGAGDKVAIEEMVSLARGGALVAVFPEGARRPKGTPRSFATSPRTGAARIAIASGVPLVPCGLVGSDYLLRFHRWHSAFGKPIYPSDYSHLSERQAAKEMTGKLWEEIQRLEEELKGWRRPGDRRAEAKKQSAKRLAQKDQELKEKSSSSISSSDFSS
jgi:1-acyl-sn-glycerol-3-phosphate acyltransferase